MTSYKMEGATRRLILLNKHLTGSNSITVTDNRTGKSYEIPIENSHIKATDVYKITN